MNGRRGFRVAIAVAMLLLALRAGLPAFRGNSANYVAQDRIEVDGWKQISDVVEQYDPHCRGVLLLGLDAPEDELRESFGTAAPFPICKGFAVGRSIFGAPARQWFNGEINDDEVVDIVSSNYKRMIDFWQDAESGTKVDSKHSATA